VTDLRDQAPGEPKPDRSFYYVDEAGDPTLFDRKGRVIVGQPGCSRFFVLGKIDVADPDGLAAQLAELRRALLADPYFAGVPSMAPTQRKTARLLHAKDDLPEVRREVFKLLVNSDFRFYAVVRDKRVIAQKVLEHNQRKPAYRYKPNQLYDRCIPLLFQERLHKETAYRIVFARRGSSDRTDAFARGLQTARERLRQKRGIESSAPIEVVPSDPATVICLQAVDYCLWAVQRCFERGEHRYLNLLWDHVGLIVDRDDTAERPTGEYYHRRRPMRPNLRA
jgi:hypothetical protein